MHHGTTRPRAIALLAFSLAIAGCGRKPADAAATDSLAAVPVSVGPENIAIVGTAPIASGPSISGQLAAEREATVRAQTSGAVLATMADQGSRVGAGAILARIDDRTARDQFLSARSNMTSAQSAADIAERDFKRNETLAAAGAIADRDLDVARRSNVAAQSQLADARARVTLAQKAVEDAQVRSPFSGIVSAKQVSAGDVVQPGAALFTVIDPRSMRLEAAVPASRLDEVRIGAPVTFSVNGYPGRSFVGRVTRINPAADPTTGQVRIVASIPNEKSSLVGGLFADGRVESEKRDGIVAPVNAVDVRGVRPFVVRLKGGKVEKIEVQVGLRDEETERMEIVSGLAIGDTLLVGAAQGLTPGTVVRVSAPADAPVAKR